MQSGFHEQKAELFLNLRRYGISDAILRAIESIPREAFLSGMFQSRAYEDTALPIACGQTISQPSVVARLTHALEVTDRCKVLEIGAGSGYQAAVLGKLARRVYAIERHRALARSARDTIQRLDIPRVNILTGDGTLGLPEQAPFDRIILSAAAEDPPQGLLDQLKVGGIMVLPVGQSDTIQQMIKVVKTQQGIEYTELGEIRFVPLVEGIAEDVQN